MIKAVLIDDELHCLDTLALLLGQHCPEVQIAAQCRSASTGLTTVQQLQPDLVFLDIEMPVMNGFQLLEHVSDIRFAVIFTTSYDQYAVKAIKFSALDYLLKPIDAPELVQAVQKVAQQKTLPLQEQFQMLLRQMEGVHPPLHKIAIPTLEGYELIGADKVVRLEADNNYTHLFLDTGARITACRTLKEMEAQLQCFAHFVRVHHSYLVNLNEVVKYVRGEGGYLVMSDGSTVNVSRSRKEALLRHF